MKAQTLINMAETVLAIMREKGLIDESHAGGYMTVLPHAGPHVTPLLVVQIGELTNPWRIETYYSFSQEKAKRLFLDAVSGHWSSWQSRNPHEDNWGGAIRAGDYILSFSGLPELADEALMLAVALKLEIIGPAMAVQIAGTSGNDIFRQLYDL